MQQVEREVDKHYLNNLMNECRREKVTQRQMMQEARCARTAADGAEPLPVSMRLVLPLPSCVAASPELRGCSVRWYMGAERKNRRHKAENIKMPACQELKGQGYDVGY